MQHQFLQVFRLAFYLIKAVIYIVFTITLGSDLSHVHSLIETGIVLGAVFAALAFFDPIVDIVLQASLIALVVLVAHGNCSNPTLETGVRACVTTAGETAFDAITDVIHRLLALLPHHSLPKVIQTQGANIRIVFGSFRKQLPTGNQNRKAPKNRSNRRRMLNRHLRPTSQKGRKRHPSAAV